MLQMYQEAKKQLVRGAQDVSCRHMKYEDDENAPSYHRWQIPRIIVLFQLRTSISVISIDIQ